MRKVKLRYKQLKQNKEWSNNPTDQTVQRCRIRKAIRVGINSKTKYYGKKIIFCYGNIPRIGI